MCFRICKHLKEDGMPCGSPALRGGRLCYYHNRDQQRLEFSGSAIRRADVLGPRLPHMKSLADVQSALYEVITALATDRVSTRRAGRILFDLEQAALPFRRQNAPPT
jgi:hypothetical protein